MTLYTELGIKESATREKVRAAYLRLAKEAHPDKSHSESERIKAESIMLRLNQIMLVLGDDEKRNNYDAHLKQQREEAEIAIRQALALQLEAGRDRPVWMRWSSRMWFAGMMFLVAGIAGVVWFSDFKETEWWQEASQRRARRAAVELENENRASAKIPQLIVREASPEPEQVILPVAARPLRAEEAGPRRESALVAEARLALKAPREKPQIPVTAAVVKVPDPKADTREVSAPPPAPSVAPPMPEAPTVTHREAINSWRGIWRYLPALGGGPGGQFTPLAIEMRLQETGAGVHGIYKASYEGTGKKYSPDVVLSLAGQTEGSQVHGEWTSPEGAHGGFELKRVESRVVQVSWWTTALGRKAALASGVARLVESAQ